MLVLELLSKFLWSPQSSFLVAQTNAILFPYAGILWGVRLDWTCWVQIANWMYLGKIGCIIVQNSEQSLDNSVIGRPWHFYNGFYFLRISLQTFLRKYVSNILHFFLFDDAFLSVQLFTQSAGSLIGIFSIMPWLMESRQLHFVISTSRLQWKVTVFVVFVVWLVDSSFFFYFVRYLVPQHHIRFLMNSHLPSFSNSTACKHCSKIDTITQNWLYKNVTTFLPSC